MHRDTLASHLGHNDQLMYFAAAEGVPLERVRLSMLERMVEPCGPRPRRLRGTKDEEIVQGGLHKQLEDAAAKLQQAAGEDPIGSSGPSPLARATAGARSGGGAAENDEYDLDAGAAGRAGDGEEEEDDEFDGGRSG